MKAKICDRCGKICGGEKIEVHCTKYKKIKKIFFGREEIDCDSYNIDLCSECASEFEKWLDYKAEEVFEVEEQQAETDNNSETS